jgi:hypothetical protein
LRPGALTPAARHRGETVRRESGGKGVGPGKRQGRGLDCGPYCRRSVSPRGASRTQRACRPFPCRMHSPRRLLAIAVTWR